ncbi:hypothetical protein [Sphingosinithalassobacter portus]|uniref:hypothetical protein n=1 Tax=Stakelama portus TaxID=2676234 RepID=UPI000D6E0D96|nr:hypothetical protein [Sphingosinithalassobacter portus]
MFRAEIPAQGERTRLPIFVSMDDTAESTALDIRATFEDGVLRVTGSGAWNRMQLTGHFARLHELIRPVRERGEPLLALIDMRGITEMPDEIVAVIDRETARLYQEQDRVAVMVASSLVKMQMKRAAEKAQREFFLSAKAALTWLTAYRDIPAGRA